MRRRSKARECALQILYEVEISRKDLNDCVENYWEDATLDDVPADDRADVRKFATELVRGVLGHMEKIDAEIEKYAEHWKMSRMAVVDRNILRLGTCEILFVDEVPSKVAINEAVDIAKKFGDAESSKFVNGILDKIAKESVKGL